MAGFFSLGGGGAGRGTNTNHPQNHLQSSGGNNPQNNPIGSEGWFLYRNEDVSYRPSSTNFELWQQNPQPHHHHHHQNQEQIHQRHNHAIQDLYSSAGVLAVGPSPSGIGTVRDDEPARSGFLMTSGGKGGVGAGASVSCQDCGNQAKKDCPHMRCRSCCKSRGFQCSTHVKSTWVPAAKRREKLQQLESQQQQQQLEQRQQQLQQQQQYRENPKRQRENQIASTTGLEVGNFPAEVNSAAVFRCVRVTSVDDADEQYAYQTAVNIGGHIFKGILYDQGLEHVAGESSSGTVSGQNLIPAATATGATASSSGIASGPPGFLDSSLFSAHLNNFMPGTPFFANPRS